MCSVNQCDTFPISLTCYLYHPLMNYIISSGLCGTYDGDFSNDRRYPDGRLDTSRASEPNEYIKSWRYVVIV